jgi:hypothetical protein
MKAWFRHVVLGEAIVWISAIVAALVVVPVMMFGLTTISEVVLLGAALVLIALFMARSVLNEAFRLGGMVVIAWLVAFGVMVTTGAPRRLAFLMFFVGVIILIVFRVRRIDF